MKFETSQDVWRVVQKELNKFQPIDSDVKGHLESIFKDLSTSEAISVLRELLYEISEEKKRRYGRYGG